eukprot:333312-Pleurochrysis_carterae.AAC.1
MQGVASCGESLRTPTSQLWVPLVPQALATAARASLRASWAHHCSLFSLHIASLLSLLSAFEGVSPVPPSACPLHHFPPPPPTPPILSLHRRPGLLRPNLFYFAPSHSVVSVEPRSTVLCC